MSEDDTPTLEELEDQEWQLDDDKHEHFTHEFLNGHEMTFRVQDPDEEVIVDYVMGNTLSQGDDGEENYSESMFKIVEKSVIAPRISVDEWRKMRATDRMAIGDKVLECIGVDRLMGFRDGGLEDLLEDLLSGSPESGDSQ